MMHRLCRQLYQVGALYVLKPRFWVVAMYVAFILAMSVRLTSPSNLVFLMSFGFLIANFLMENLAQQVMHYRSRLLPGFGLPHAIVPVAVVLIVMVLIPALIGGAALSSMAVAATFIVLSLLLAQFPRVFVGFLVLIVGIQVIFAITVADFVVEFSSALAIPIILASIGATVIYFYRRVQSFEDDTQRNKSSQRIWETAALSTDLRTHQQLGREINTEWGATKSSDRRLDQRFQFHDYHPERIAKLLRLSLGATPTVMKAGGLAIVPVAIACLFILRVPVDEESDYSGFFWLFSTVFAALMPGAQAGVELSGQRTHLPSELMRPLTREQLIDGLFKAASSNALVTWLAANTGMAAALFLVPDIKVSALLIVTFSVLSASIASLMFGFALYDIKLTSVAERIVWLSIAVIVCFGAMSLWWAQRAEIGDLPFWLVAAVLGAAGIALKKNARQMWLILELA